MRSIALLTSWFFRGASSCEQADALTSSRDLRRPDLKEINDRLLATLQANIGKSYVYAKCVASNGSVGCERMDARTSVMRVGQPGMGSVLVVTNYEGELEQLANRLAAAGFYAFAAVPLAAAPLVASMILDLVIVLQDVDVDDGYLAPIREGTVARTHLTVIGVHETDVVRVAADRLSE